MSRATDLEQAVASWLDWNKMPYVRVSNYRCFNCGQVMNSPAKGMPDFIVMPKDKLVAVECKTGAGRLTEDQKTFRDNWIDAEGIYLVCRDTIDELENWFAKG